MVVGGVAGVVSRGRDARGAGLGGEWRGGLVVAIVTEGRRALLQRGKSRVSSRPEGGSLVGGGRRRVLTLSSGSANLGLRVRQCAWSWGLVSIATSVVRPGCKGGCTPFWAMNGNEVKSQRVSLQLKKACWMARLYTASRGSTMCPARAHSTRRRGEAQVREWARLCDPRATRAGSDEEGQGPVTMNAGATKTAIMERDARRGGGGSKDRIISDGLKWRSVCLRLRQGGDPGERPTS